MFIFVLAFVASPFVLFGINLYNGFVKKPFYEKIMAAVSLLGGGFWYGLVFLLCHEFNDFVPEIHLVFFVMFFLVGLVFYFIALLTPVSKPMKPIVVISLIIISLLNIVNILAAIFILMDMTAYIECMLIFYHLNILVLTVNVTRKHLA